MSGATFSIGRDLEVRRLGFGAMRITADRDEGIRVLRRAVELGVNLIDTADLYGPETSDLLIAEALHPYPAGLVIATKGGIAYGPDAGRPRDGRPEYLRGACERSLRRLRLDRIDLYQLHRHDPDVPLEETIGALAELQREGKIRHIGLSNVGVEQLERARAVVPIATVQNELSRWIETSDAVLEACETASIGFMPWSSLGDGKDDPGRELRWLLERSPVLLPIPGTGSVSHLEELRRAA